MTNALYAYVGIVLLTRRLFTYESPPLSAFAPDRSPDLSNYVRRQFGPHSKLDSRSQRALRFSSETCHELDEFFYAHLFTSMHRTVEMKNSEEKTARAVFMSRLVKTLIS